VETVVAGFGNPHLLALDATHLYFGAQLNKPCAGIWKVAK
jgi:hypothetical protein